MKSNKVFQFFSGNGKNRAGASNFSAEQKNHVEHQFFLEKK